MSCILDFVNYLVPVQHEQDRRGVFIASKLVGTVATVALGIFFSMGLLSTTVAAVLGASSLLVLLGGFTERPRLIYLGMLITALWLSSFIDVKILSAYDTPTTIKL